MATAKSESFQQCVTAYELKERTSEASTMAQDVIKLIDGLNSACSKGGFVEKGATPASREHWYTRAAGVLTRFITHPNTRLNKNDLRAFSLRKQSVVYIFAASGYRGMTHLVDLVKEEQTDTRITINRQRAAVLLAFVGLDDTPEELITVALQQPPDVLIFYLLGWLNQRAVLTEQGEKNRGRLLTSGQLLENVSLTDKEIFLVVNVWMYSTYAGDPNKHDIKKWLNRLLAKLLRDSEIVAQPVFYELRQRPKILVIHERFTLGHAMYRCYAPMLRTLGKYFDTVALGDSEFMGAGAEEIFDEVVRLPEKRPPISDIVALIEEQAADVIYYPSIGMSFWTVMIAGLRLAPIQVMSHGHPATSMLQTIDNAYLQDFQGDLSLITSEQVIRGPALVRFDSHKDLPAELPKLAPPSPREVRVAVNSKVMKLSWGLIEVCKRLEQAADVPVTFSFFPGERLLFMDGLEAAIRSQLPMAKIMPNMDYQPFLDELSKCDLSLAAFPFGNTNSTVDTCLLGLPTVAYLGAETAAQTDALVLGLAGLPNWLVCENEEDYFNTALRLVNDPMARREAMAGFDRDSMRDRLIAKNSLVAEEDPFGAVMLALHRNFLTLQSSDERVVDYKDVLKMNAAS